MCKEDLKTIVAGIIMLVLILFCGYWVFVGSSDVDRYSSDQFDEMARVDYVRSCQNDSVSYK